MEVRCFHHSIFQPETAEGLRRFIERDHPDRRKDEPSVTPGLDNTTLQGPRGRGFKDSSDS
jgi:hypothetical protein